MTIQETALGFDHPDVAVTLEGYAALLYETHRDVEAVVFEDRAKAIRAKAGSARDRGVTVDGTPPKAAEPTGSDAPTPLTIITPGSAPAE